ncbi:class I SAM-dependent methyltransferase [Lentzea sp. NPDC054927]
MPTLDNEELGKRLASSFGTDAARYDRTRPPYPAELVQKIVTASPGPRVVDVGCGTGTLSRQLQAAGLDVLGVEHDELMAEFAVATGVPVEVSKFENWDPAGREFDAVVAGQSWHWVNADEGQRQAARVLRPGGVFVGLWHAFAMPDPVAEALSEVYRRIAPEMPFRLGYNAAEAVASYRSGCERTAESFLATGEFSGSELWSAQWDQSYTTAEYLDLILTMSPLALLTNEQVTEVLDCVGTAIDAAGGAFTMTYETLAVAITRS